jgi:hypothetical protein
MKILKIHEPEEGSKCCRLDCEFDQDELEILLSYAVTNILRKQMERMDKECEK